MSSVFARDTEREKFSRRHHFQIFPVKASRDASPDGRVPRRRRRVLPRKKTSRGRAVVVSRSWTPGVVDVKLSSTFARIGLLTLKFSLTFTDFPSNVCVVPMLAFFVYARFFLPTTRRRGRQSRPTRVMRFRHATRDASSENETTTTTTTKKKKRKEFLQREREERRRGRRMCYTFRCSKRKKETCQSFLLL